ncbi:hypothetical protein BGZ52_012580 [Haplosporangium bisporale]|nr:hypothetical protein BGZ52_012580 [Haplosporangium bisporale]
MEFSSFLPSFPPSRSNSRRVSALTISSPTSHSPVLTPEPTPVPMPHLSASRVLFEEGLYSDITVILQVPGSTKKILRLHSRILAKESEFFATLLAGKKHGDKAIVLLDEKDSHGSRVIEIQCVDTPELYAFESSLRLLYTGSWCSDCDFQTSSLDARLRRGLDVMSQAARLSLKGSTTALLQEEITTMCQNQPELLEKVSRTLRPEDREDDQAILKFDRDALQVMCRVAVTKVEIRDHCELAIARNLYGPKKFRDLRMSEVQLAELRPGYIFPPGGQESIYLLKGAPSLPLHPCRASNVEALRHVVDYYTAYNSQQPLRTREFYAVPDEEAQKGTDLQKATDAVDENADRRNDVYFGEFASTTDGDVYLQGVNYIADGLLHAFQDPTLESFRNPGTSGSLLNMISYGINSLTDLPPLRARPETKTGDVHQDYPGLSTLVMEFFWQVLELALKRPHHLEFVQLLLDSITRIAPLSPFDVVDRIEERLAELLEETRKRIMEQRGDAGEAGDDAEEGNEDEVEDEEEAKDKLEEEIRIGRERTYSNAVHSDVSNTVYEDFDDRTSMVSSVLLASEPIASKAAVINTRAKDEETASLLQEEPEPEQEPEVETPWMRPEYLQPLCLQLLTKFPMNIQSSLLWAIHDLQLL